MQKTDDHTENTTFEFLSDDASHEDVFTGKGHERSARSLANAILKFSNDNRSIGLEGAWGSGKTTVVAMAEKELEKSYPSKFKFFTFDLWTNQSVDFRRAFLEEFLCWSTPFIHHKEAERLKKKIQGKTKEVDTKSERQFSIFGYIFMTALFMLPFIALWLSPFSASLHLNEPTEREQIPFLFTILVDHGHLAALTIIFAVILSFLTQTITLWKEKKSLRKALDSSFSLFIGKSDKDIVTQTIRDGDPTKFEFHDLFTEILSLAQPNEQRIVFIFDNIDRLPSSHIQEVWSNVRAVFSRDNQERRQHQSIVTAVVPYDRQYIINTFEDTSNKENENPKEKPIDYVYEDVFRKTFSAIISVAPPVTSDVEAFFTDCLDKALDNQISAGEKYRAFQLFDIFLNKNSLNPTPRQIKSLVNDTGMLWHQWQGSISIEAITIFLLHRSKIERNPRCLQNIGTIDSRYRHFSTPELDRELAALAYNVEPRIALEVLLERDIISAFKSPDSSRIINLSHAPGFKQQLDRILSQHTQNWANSSIDDFETALSNYAELSLETPIKELCNKHFSDAVSHLTQLTPDNWDSHTKLFKLVAITQSPLLPSLVRTVSAWANSNLPQEKTLESGRQWIRLIGGLLKEVRDQHGNECFQSCTKQLSIPYSPQILLGMAIDCNEIDIHFQDITKISEKVTSELTESLANLGNDHPKLFSYAWTELKFAFKKAEKTKIFDKLVNILQSGPLNGSEDRQAYLKALALVASDIQRDDEVVKKLRLLINEGILGWHASEADSEGDWKSIAYTIWLTVFSFLSDPPRPSASANKPPFGDLRPKQKRFIERYQGDLSTEVISCISDIIINLGNINLWISAFSENPKHAMFRAVLENIFNKDNCPAINLKTLASHYSVLKVEFDQETLDSTLIKTGQYTPNEAPSNLNIELIDAKLIEDIDKLGDRTWTNLINHVENHLKSLTASEWENALREPDHNRKLFLSRANEIKGKISPNQLRAPLTDFVCELTSLRDDPKEYPKNHSAFWLALPSSSRKAVSRDVFERLDKRPVEPNGLSIAISTFPDLFRDIPLVKNPETSISKILIQLLMYDIDFALEYIKQSPADWRSCVEKARADTISQLTDHLSGFGSQSDEVVKKVDELRKILKLKITTEISETKKLTGEQELED
ncbi:P-loop NTPase fold protein [Marinimicrobium alkaliphilum]|uniref:P-loop NTPase fold protein n=1 Tax=Marinimicrobium alkaliphilum TaxID=2202654 RepID=UPI001300611D|nr:P-loop NTPase fold protein [Marinimicrobium alkaliphilum]